MCSDNNIYRNFEVQLNKFCSFVNRMQEAAPHNESASHRQSEQRHSRSSLIESHLLSITVIVSESVHVILLSECHNTFLITAITTLVWQTREVFGVQLKTSDGESCNRSQT